MSSTNQKVVVQPVVVVAAPVSMPSYHWAKYCTLSSLECNFKVEST